MSKRIVMAAIATLSILASGCEKEGPAERAGESLDDAARELQDSGETLGNQLEDACEEVKGEIGASDTNC